MLAADPGPGCAGPRPGDALVRTLRARADDPDRPGGIRHHLPAGRAPTPTGPAPPATSCARRLRADAGIGQARAAGRCSAGTPGGARGPAPGGRRRARRAASCSTPTSTRADRARVPGRGGGTALPVPELGALTGSSRRIAARPAPRCRRRSPRLPGPTPSPLPRLRDPATRAGTGDRRAGRPHGAGRSPGGPFWQGRPVRGRAGAADPHPSGSFVGGTDGLPSRPA
ncbi:hypothetical protein HBB16_15120 [Pseudonocardia sp. MCCB 268]|nr:hypothetical protein [Pseudonocardia cytotoxica]